MDIMHEVMDFDFDTRKVQETHFHQNLEIIYVLDGAAEIQIETEKYELKKGEFLLVNANKRHSLAETEGELLIAGFRINFTKLAEYLGTNQILFWCNSGADKNEAYEPLKQVLNRILNRFYDRENEGALYLNSIYYEALYLLTSYFRIKADDSRLKGKGAPDNSRVFEIQNYVQANYQKQISLNDLAKKLYLSNAYLSKYIKKRFGLSFLEYVNNIRLFHAVDDLLYTEKKITRIALDNGFPTTASFNKAFQDIYSVCRPHTDNAQSDRRKKKIQDRSGERSSHYHTQLQINGRVATKKSGVVRGGCEQNSPAFKKLEPDHQYRKDRRASGQRHAAAASCDERGDRFFVCAYLEYFCAGYVR